jgi:hypothetical protein
MSENQGLRSSWIITMEEERRQIQISGRYPYRSLCKNVHSPKPVSYEMGKFRFIQYLHK